MIIWQQGGNRLFFDLTVRASNSKVGVVQQQTVNCRARRSRFPSRMTRRSCTARPRI
jgi:hypothetical protein